MRYPAYVIVVRWCRERFAWTQCKCPQSLTPTSA